ncbi:pectate lyase-like adhesive domain-containing protein, partial [Enterococcus faecalis]
MKCKLREKQLRKKIKKTKKGLTLAATALILNGSLMPINNVFANEQSKDSTTAVSSEKVETNFLKSEIPNVNLQNNTEKEQATQSSIITNENSSNVQGEDKEKVTEGKSDVDLQNSTEKEQATQNSIITNENSSNVQGEDKEKVTEDKSDELKIVRSTRLSDGRIAKDISTPDQLQEAFYDATIGQVNLVSDITLTKNILMDSQKNPQLVINGNNHILDFGLFSITTTGSRDQYDRNINVKLMNLQTRNGGGWGAVTPYDGVVELENINHEGTTLVNSRGMRLSGKINCMVNKPSQEGGLSTYWAKSPENYITISSGADVVVDQSLATGCQFTAINAKALNLEENSKLTVRTPLWQKWGVICIDREGKVDVGKGAQLNVETSADCPAISFYRSSLELRVANGGEINARSAGDYAITMDAANSIVNLSGAKFNIQSTKANGVPLFMAAGSTVSFDNQNVRAWLKGSATSTNPRYSWDNVSGVVNMSGATTTSVSSYNTDFQSSFKNQNFSRISSNGTAKQELTKTTINEVKDTDTTVSGKGEPNAPIMIKVGDQPIGNGTVDSEGNYSVPIQKQSAGTNIKAVVTKDGLSSEASTTVTKSSL